MRFPFPLILVLLIPAMIALGHDIFLFFNNHVNDPLMVSTGLIEEKFKFSAFGFIWTNYEPESYRATARSMSPESWAMLDKFLTIKAFFAGLYFAGGIIAIMMVLAFFKIGPMAGEKDKVFKSGKSQYSRK